MVNEDAGNVRFRVVGAGYRTYEPEKNKRSFSAWLKGKPVFSAVVLTLIILGCIFAPMIANHDPSKLYYDHISEAPNAEFLFGTDYLGRDLFSIMFFGGRTSVCIGLLGAAIISVIGIIYGTINGIVPEKADSAMMRLTEMLGSIPSLLFILILSAVFPMQNVLSLSVIIGITGWFGLARIVRSEVRQIRNTEYVLYARCSGGRLLYVMWRHLIPNFLSSIMFVIVSSIGSCITTESTLSFLGLGLPIDKLSWGSMLSLANRALILNTWWVIVTPGLFLIITLMCITNIGNYLRKETNRRPGII